MIGSINIGEAARVLGVPTSKLRYWESVGLLNFEREGSGDYRKFTFSSLAEVADVLMAREIGISLAELKGMRTLDHIDQRALLDSVEAAAEEKIAYYERITSIIHKRREAMRTWSRTVSKGMHHAHVQLDPIYHFDFTNKEMVQLYLSDSSEAVDIIPLDGSSDYSYGRFMKNSDWELLRPGDASERDYLVGPLWMNQRTRETNVLELVEKARAMGYEPKSCIGRYLFVGGLSWFPDSQDSYYTFKAYFEI